MYFSIINTLFVHSQEKSPGRKKLAASKFLSWLENYPNSCRKPQLSFTCSNFSMSVGHCWPNKYTNISITNNLINYSFLLFPLEACSYSLFSPEASILFFFAPGRRSGILRPQWRKYWKSQSVGVHGTRRLRHFRIYRNRIDFTYSLVSTPTWKYFPRFPHRMFRILAKILVG